MNKIYSNINKTAENNRFSLNIEFMKKLDERIKNVHC